MSPMHSQFMHILYVNFIWPVPDKANRLFKNQAIIFISQFSRQETNTLSSEGLPMSNTTGY